MDRVDVALVELFASALDLPADARNAIEFCRSANMHAARARSCPRFGTRSITVTVTSKAMVLTASMNAVRRMFVSSRQCT